MPRHRRTGALPCFLLLTATAWTQPVQWAVLETLYDPAATQPIIAVDLDGDGVDDLVDSSGGWVMNDGHGRFTLQPGPGVLYNYPIFNFMGPSYGSAAGDVDADGDADVLIGAGFRLWRNDGLPPFSNLSPTLVPASARDVTLGDVDGDGDLDAFASGSDALGTGTLWLNSGLGAYTPSPGLPTVQSTFTASFLDLDADGDLDLAVGRLLPQATAPLDTVMMLNSGSGVFSLQPSATVSSFSGATVAIGDVNNDGLPDVACLTSPAGGVGIRLNLGGSFGPLMTPPGAPELANARPMLLDLNADGWDELVVATRSDGLRVYYASVTGIAPAAQVIPVTGSWMVPGDFDGDGDLDLVVSAAAPSSASVRTQVLLNDGQGGLAMADRALRTPGGDSQAPVPLDADGDGDVDLVTIAEPLRVHLNDGRGNLLWDPALGQLQAGALDPGPYTRAVRIDANGDARDDLLITRSLSPGVNTVLINNGVSWTDVPLPTSAFLASIVSGDVDGDGITDLVMAWNTPAATQIQKLTGLGGGQFASPAAVNGSLVYNISDLCLSDLDDDGDLDLLYTTATDGAVSLNDGQGSFAPPSYLGPGAWGSRVVAGDLDGDGDADAVTDGRVWRNDGNAVLSLWGNLPGLWPVWTTDLFITDIDGDGTNDVMSSLGYWWRNGNSTWIQEGLPQTWSPLPVADFDRDGDADLIARDSTDANVLVQNLTRQLASRGPIRLGRPAGFDLLGEPGAVWELWFATGPGSLSITEGLVQIDPLTAVPLVSGVLPPGGGVSVETMVGAQPSLVGQRLDWQAVIHGTGGARVTTAETTVVVGY